MQRLRLKRRIAKIWPAQSCGRAVILLYHSVGNTKWGMPIREFTEQINWLCDNCNVLSLTDLITQPKNQDELRVAITFDDGYATLYNHVLPLLSQKKKHATVYLNTGWISDHSSHRRQSDAQLGHYPEEFFLVWKEVKELYQAGWEIGSHGVNHHNFTRIKNESVHQELLNSRQDIERRLQADCLHFSYPWGQYTAHLKESVKIAGYQYAVAARHAEIKQHSDLFALPRINISRDYSLADFKDIVRGKWDYLGLIHKMKGL